MISFGHRKGGHAGIDGRILIVCLLLFLLGGCGGRKSDSTSSPLFVDVASLAGIHFTHSNGATGHFYFIEFPPAGCAFLDYDNDGYPDILLLQSGPSDPPWSIQSRPPCALYHNNGNGTFTEVTQGSGLDKNLGYVMGVAVGDYDNDGYGDLFITSYGHNWLFHNEHGTGKFVDVTHKMGLDRVHSTGFATSAAFGDYDNDGRLDLYVCYYSPWSYIQDQACFYTGMMRDYCDPHMYPPDTHQLFHNEGDHFTDVTHAAGIDQAQGRGLVAAFLDYDDDGRPDIFVGDDATPNMLWHNEGNGKFTNRAVPAGVALDVTGHTMASMGIGLADYDHSGRQSLFVSNFSRLPNTLFHNQGGGLFQDVSIDAGVVLPHLKYLAFGCEFLDYDADGWPDLFIANGHVYIHSETMHKGITYPEPKQLFHNDGNGHFTEVTDSGFLGNLAQPTVSRGLAVGDYDNDGRLDVLVSNQNGPAQLFHNEVHNGNHWIQFKTVGVKSNRDGIGAKFVLTAGGVRQTAFVHGGSSYLSASDLRVYFGLGQANAVDQVQIRWPSGKVDRLSHLPADAIYIVTEGHGITGNQPAKPHTAAP